MRKLYFLCKEIGLPQLAEYATYQLAKKIGLLAKKTPPGGLSLDFTSQDFRPGCPIAAPDRTTLSALEVDKTRLIKNAEEIISGFYHPFGGNKQPLSFELKNQPLEHWTKYGDTCDGQDIKWIWEPARFSWAFDLARAYLINAEEQYVKFFWEKFEQFENMNPVNCGPNWASAQEAAMRILTWAMVYQVFKDSPTTTIVNSQHLFTAIWQHAARIPPTLSYARSQKNNHHLSEALGLVVAGALFGEKSERAEKWLKLGFHEFKQGLINQIDPDGTYSQHSANYHRLMLQLSLIYFSYTKSLRIPIPSQVTSRLAGATRWMNSQLDPQSGRLPNLGHNDGTLLLPMGCEEFRDYRPTVQAASLAFLGGQSLPHGKWDELSFWLGLLPGNLTSEIITSSSPAVHKIVSGNSWASLRGVRFHGRPGHADQLHLDTWWDGINLALDAGTFSYNDPIPWQNPFSTTLMHNTISIDGKDQMKQAGKFLWLEQAQAEWLATKNTNILCARQDGYRNIGVSHQRTAEYTTTNQLLVTDLVKFTGKYKEHQVMLHWLLPDWKWKLEGKTLVLDHEAHQVRITVSAIQLEENAIQNPEDLSVIRGGDTLLGERYNPMLGWISDSYGVKKPALSFSAAFQTGSDLQIISDWIFAIQSATRKD